MEISQSSDAIDIQKTSQPAVFWVLGILVSFILGVGAGYLIFARPVESQLRAAQAAATAASESAAAAQQQAAAQQANQEVKRYPVPIDNNPVLGKADAPITLIEFSDYECPFCRRWHQEVFPLIQQKYGDKIRFVYRDFPLTNIHPNALPAAVAANCAGEQGRYWEFNARLFDGTDPLSRATYEKIAADYNLNTADFAQCLDENRYQAEVEADFAYASELGVRSTPTFFINGLAVVGAQPFEVFEQIIDMELAGEIP